MNKLTVNFHPQRASVNITDKSLTVGMGTPVAKEYIDADPYMGPYSATPSAEAQTFSTRNLRMTEDFVVNPIPSNYGLITWDGSTLTVS